MRYRKYRRDLYHHQSIGHHMIPSSIRCGQSGTLCCLQNTRIKRSELPWCFFFSGQHDRQNFKNKCQKEIPCIMYIRESDVVSVPVVVGSGALQRCYEYTVSFGRPIVKPVLYRI